MPEAQNDITKAKEEVREFLLQDYRLKSDMVTAHYGRILTRFDYFLLIKSGMVTATGYLMEKGLQTPMLFICIAGFLSSIFWFLTSRADRKIAVVYRDDVIIVYQQILRFLPDISMFDKEREKSFDSTRRDVRSLKKLGEEN